MTTPKIPVGISSCLLGENVRFDGGHKRDAYITGTLNEYFEFRPCCPEVEIGLGVPRPTLHLVNGEDGVRCVGVKDASRDVTDLLRGHADRLRERHAELCGYILKKDSPSCGMERVKVYDAKGMAVRQGAGIYAQRMMHNNPLLPVEEEGRLGDPVLRENFIERVFVLRRWKSLLSEGLTPHRLITFHARHKLSIMSHDQNKYRELGRLVAGVEERNLAAVADEYIVLLMRTLKKPATRGNHVNVLQHIQGYLKKQLDADDKAELGEIIERYRIGELPLIVPVTLLKHHFRRCPEPYIDNSYYMSPYPQQLKLINQL
jgi:uncharacterized protein YbgA (DUF1722 family)/uncharacterized protein YbbK (DUF523 family)